MQFKIDFDQYVPVQHEPTQGYLAFRVAENKDFDTAADTDLYKCYPVMANGKMNPQKSFLVPKAELQMILLLL
ncbi:hypothetical protein [Adhaeribacter pallidiroseus]|uniref:Uncharacterized protein n=1 Tax=Adhaeribacter pallidiroseus TaxID=2072847 RepID=A0A369Q216_9BACT|nr:hypothetical protein [Adhaeribacter pallidiroseus]RDC58804.1 hypothetical protein AHMF7616_05238 [Adhaeribacter pallidiroseus]